jgi:hypothetical protein
MKQVIRDYSGTAAHLHWLVSGQKHPQQSAYEFLKMIGVGGLQDSIKWDLDFDRVDKETKATEEDEEISEEEKEDSERVEENEEFEMNK